MLHRPSKIALGLATLAFLTNSAEAARQHLPIGPTCWTVDQITAAKVYEFSIYLNVQSLRCRSVDPQIQNQFDTFVTASQSSIKNVSGKIKRHFKGNPSAFDRYAVTLANKYGGGMAGQTCTDVSNIMQSAIKTGAVLSDLSATAEQAKIDPEIVGGACPIVALKPFIAKGRSPMRRHRRN